MNFIDKRNFKEDHVQVVRAHDPRTNKPKVRFLSPSMVVNVSDEEELKAQLAHYSSPLFSEQVPDSTLARKNYVEHLRPALRYWCAKFGVTVPEWLKDEKRFINFSDEEKLKFFGTDKLRVAEFKKFKVSPLSGIEKELGGAKDSK